MVNNNVYEVANLASLAEWLSEIANLASLAEWLVQIANLASLAEWLGCMKVPWTYISPRYDTDQW